MSHEIVKGRYAISHNFTDRKGHPSVATIYMTFESSNNVSPRTFHGHVVAVTTHDPSWSTGSLPSRIYQWSEHCDNGCIKLYNGSTTAEAWISHWKKEKETPIPASEIYISFYSTLYLPEKYNGKILANEITGYYAESCLAMLAEVYQIDIHQPLQKLKFDSYPSIDQIANHLSSQEIYREKYNITTSLSCNDHYIESLAASRRQHPYQSKQTAAKTKPKWQPGEQFTNGKATYELIGKISPTRWSCILVGGGGATFQVTSVQLNRMKPVTKAAA